MGIIVPPPPDDNTGPAPIPPDTLRALSDAATPGPWEYLFKGRFEVPVDIDVTEADWGGEGLREYRLACEEDWNAWRVEDAQFLVAAVNYVRSLLGQPGSTPGGDR